jgi:hypothetical protein
MKTPLPRPLTPHQWRRLVKLYRSNRQLRHRFYKRRRRMEPIPPMSAAIAWEYAKETLFPLNFP